ncbi:MAG: hypothetical protein ABSB15_17920 [Bryobacteraceae bacterium]|jgi:hypothetical protein
MRLKWDRSDVLALAKEDCTQCRGFGLRGSGGTGEEMPCNCVFRSIFRACYKRFRHCASGEKHVSHARLEQVNGKEHRQTWGMKDEEFMADFCLVARRNLGPLEYRIFRFHYLLGADWRLCCRRMKMERGDFFHAVYRLQQKLGRVFKELKPYPLYPLDEYFGGTVRTSLTVVDRKLFDMPPRFRKRYRLIAPLRKVA